MDNFINIINEATLITEYCFAPYEHCISETEFFNKDNKYFEYVELIYLDSTYKMMTLNIFTYPHMIDWYGISNPSLKLLKAIWEKITNKHYSDNKKSIINYIIKSGLKGNDEENIWLISVVLGFK